MLSRTVPSTIERPGSLLALAMWAGIATGFAEVAVIAPALFGPDFAKRSVDAVWMIPAFDGVVFLSAGLLLGGLARFVRVPWQVAAGIFAGMGMFLVLLLFPSLHQLAALVLAAGIGSAVARVVSNRVIPAARAVRRSLPWLAGSVAVIAVLMVGWRAAHEHWLIHHRRAARPGAPNVLLLILDTVRAVNLSLNGYPRRTTPELESFAERGTTFDLAFATASWTTLSHATMFTGRWPTELDVAVRHSLGPRWPTLAETLRSQGYATAGFVANQIYAGWESGLSRGFEHFEDYPVTAWTALCATSFGQMLYPKLQRALVGGRLARALNRVPLVWRLGRSLPVPYRAPSGADIAGQFLSWLDRSRPAPFFAFLNFMDAHLPYTSPDSYRYRFRSATLRPVSPQAWSDQPKVRLSPADVRPKQAMYDGSITYLDVELGGLIRELERRGLLSNTLVIVVGDHGDEFAEHGLVDHGVSLYRFSLHVPLVLSFPGRIPEHRRVAVPVSLRNLPATVVELVAPDAAPLPGRSLARFWVGPDTTADTIFASIRGGKDLNLPDWYPVSQGDLNSIAFNGLRYIRNEGDGAEELYDFKHDLLERYNLVDSDSGRRLVPQYRRAVAAFMPAQKAPQLSEK